MCPIGKYFKNHGDEVMDKMKQTYGADKGKSVFYATANKKPDMKPPEDQKPAKRRMSLGQRIGARD